MRTSKISRTNFRKIHSMNDLRLEKARLQTEVVRTEEKIKGNYRHIRDAFTLRNIFATVTTELQGSSILAKVITYGREWLSKRKKKKKKQHQPAPPPEETTESI